MKKSFFYITLTALLFTTLEPVSKLIAGGVDPFTMTAVRFLIGGTALLPFSILKIHEKSLKLIAGIISCLPRWAFSVFASA